MRCLLVCLVLSLTAACSHSSTPSADAPGAAVSLSWRAARPAPTDFPDRLALRLDPPAEASEWRIERPHGFVQDSAFEGEDRRSPALLLAHDAASEEHVWEIVIERPFDHESFNLLRIHLATKAGCSVGARFYRGEKLVYESRRKTWVDRSPGGTRLELAMPELRFQVKPMDRLELTVESRRSLAIRTIDFVQRDFADWLPAPAAGPEFVHLGPRARFGVGIRSGDPLEADVQLTSPASLTFSTGVPGPLEHPSRDPMTLKVLVTGAEGSRVEQSIRLPARGRAPYQWLHHEIPLDELVGSRGRVRIELETPDESIGVYVIAEAKLVQRARTPRTVVLITSDTHRYDHVGASHSGIEVSTPTLDALAARGVYFENCLTSTNVTNPSHVAIMTATHPRDTGILDNTSPLARNATTLAEHYRAAGWRTWAVLSAIHLGDRESGLGQGFDRIAIPNDDDYSAQDALDKLLDWLPEADDTPLFVWLHLFDAHIPYEPPAPFDRKYYGDGDPFDPNLPEGRIPIAELPPSLSGLRDPAYPPAQYRAEVDYLDSQLARLIAVERVAGGILALTADHGENLGHHGIYYDHGNLYPDTIHVPLVLDWPDAPAGLRIAHPVFQLDLGRTLLELSAVPAGDFPGASLLPLIEGAEPDPFPRFALSSSALSCSVNYGRWHLILHLRAHTPRNFDHGHEQHEVELYDLSADPLCTDNVIHRFPNDAEQMRRLLIDWLENPIRTGWASEGRKDPEIMRRLRNLGYTTADGSEVQLIDPDCACSWCAPYR